MYSASVGPSDPDWYARRNIHGLSPFMLKRYGVSTEKDLCDAFVCWIESLPLQYVYQYFANDPRKERELLSCLPSINDVCLPRWSERVNLASHQEALDAKRLSLSICGKRCGVAMHSSYSPFRRPVCAYPSPSSSSTQTAKQQYGYHCSLYDSLECYYFHKNYV